MLPAEAARGTTEGAGGGGAEPGASPQAVLVSTDNSAMTRQSAQLAPPDGHAPLARPGTRWVGFRGATLRRSAVQFLTAGPYYCSVCGFERVGTRRARFERTGRPEQSGRSAIGRPETCATAFPDSDCGRDAPSSRSGLLPGTRPARTWSSWPGRRQRRALSCRCSRSRCHRFRRR